MDEAIRSEARLPVVEVSLCVVRRTMVLKSAVLNITCDEFTEGVYFLMLIKFELPSFDLTLCV